MISDVLAELVWALEDKKDFVCTVITQASNDIDGYLSWPEEHGYSGKIRQEIIDLKTKMTEPGYLDRIEEIRTEADRIRGELDSLPPNPIHDKSGKST